MRLALLFDAKSWWQWWCLCQNSRDASLFLLLYGHGICVCWKNERRLAVISSISWSWLTSINLFVHLFCRIIMHTTIFLFLLSIGICWPSRTVFFWRFHSFSFLFDTSAQWLFVCGYELSVVSINRRFRECRFTFGAAGVQRKHAGGWYAQQSRGFSTHGNMWHTVCITTNCFGSRSSTLEPQKLGEFNEHHIDNCVSLITQLKTVIVLLEIFKTCLTAYRSNRNSHQWTLQIFSS